MKKSDLEEREDIYKAYEGHSTTLRTWLVSYGVGVPVLVLSNETIWNTFKSHQNSDFVAILFLIGVALQVILASINKNAMWHCYRGIGDEQFQKKCLYKCSSWISDQFIIDVLVDIICMGLFSWATYLALPIILAHC